MPAVFAPNGSLMYAGLQDALAALQAPSTDEVVIDLSNLAFASTGSMVPLVAYVDKIRRNGVTVEVIQPRDQLEADYCRKAGWIDALRGDPLPDPIGHRATFLPVARFTEHVHLNEMVTAALEVVTSVSIYPAGVLRAIEWVVNELADNVLVHAGEDVAGWMQVIANPQAGRVNFTVADTGRGILSSLREHFPELADDASALNMAIQPGVTRSTQIGQGNGLSGSVRIAQHMHGWLNLQSGTAELRLMDDGRQLRRATAGFPGTIVDVTLPTTAEVDVADALWGHEPVSSLELTHLVGDEIVFKVREESQGVGTRAAGLATANKLANLLVELPSERIAVDFEGLELVSASFADELVAKMISQYGIALFLSRVSLRNMTTLVARTVNAVVAQRMRVG